MATPNPILVVQEFQGGGVGDGVPRGEVNALVEQYNVLVTALRTLTAKLDADAGVTDTNYGALITAAGASSPAILTVVQ